MSEVLTLVKEELRACGHARRGQWSLEDNGMMLDDYSCNSAWRNKRRKGLPKY
jgi:hypothetical protein